MASISITGGSASFQSATDNFISTLRTQVLTDITLLPPTPVTPKRGVRQWVNLTLKAWRFLSRWRANIMADAPPSVQAVIIAVEVALEVIAALNPVGPE